MLQVVPLVGVVEGEAERLVLAESHPGQLERLVGPERGVEGHRRPDRPVAQQLAGSLHDDRDVPEHVADEHRNPGLVGGALHRVRRDHRVGDGFLDEHGNAGTAGLLCW